MADEPNQPNKNNQGGPAPAQPPQPPQGQPVQPAQPTQSEQTEQPAEQAAPQQAAQPAGPVVSDDKTQGKGHGKRPWWQWLLIYLAIGAVVYLVVYAVLVFAGGDSGSGVQY